MHIGTQCIQCTHFISKRTMWIYYVPKTYYNFRNIFSLLTVNFSVSRAVLIYIHECWHCGMNKKVLCLLLSVYSIGFQPYPQIFLFQWSGVGPSGVLMYSQSWQLWFTALPWDFPVLLPKWIRDLNEVKLSNPAGKEFKVIVIKMLTELGRRIDEFSGNFNKEIENI